MSRQRSIGLVLVTGSVLLLTACGDGTGTSNLGTTGEPSVLEPNDSAPPAIPASSPTPAPSSTPVGCDTAAPVSPTPAALGQPPGGWFECETDTECVTVSGLDCCGCNSGGGPELAMNRTGRDEVTRRQQIECRGTYCLALYGCRDELVPTCRDHACTLEATDCVRTGCNRQICADHDVWTTCEWLPEYECLRYARCERQADGSCGWTPTQESGQCLSNMERTPTATPTPTPIPGDETIPLKDVVFPGCEAVTAESRYCLTTFGGGIGVLGLESGTLCPVTETNAPLTGPFTTSLVWRGEIAYSCTQDGLIRISLRDGAWEALQIPCMAVADYRGGFLLTSTPLDPFDLGALYWYPSYDALLAGPPSQVFHVDPFFSRMTVQGDTFYGAWHSTDSIIVDDLPSEEQLGILTIEGEDDWVQGMAVTEDGYLILLRSIGGETVALYDVNTGRKLRELQPGVSMRGLSCVTRDYVTPPPTPASTPPHPPTPTFRERDPSLPSCGELAAPFSGPGRHVDYPPSIPLLESCGSGGYAASNYVNPDAAQDVAEELHVVSVYDGAAYPGFGQERVGTVGVTVHARPKPVVLYLAAYGETLWRIVLDEGTQVARVITQGYSPQRIEGLPAGTPVEHRSPIESCALAYGWEVWRGAEFPLMIADVRAVTGLVETSFQGCYSGVAFEIPYWSGEPPTARPAPIAGNESIARDQVQFGGCEAVTAESQYCLTTTYEGPAVLGLDSGTVCPVATQHPSEAAPSPVLGSPDISSIAWRGDIMYVCTYGVGLIRLSLRDGAWETAQVACEAVTNYRDGLLLLSPFQYGPPATYSFPTYEALLRGDFDAAYDDGGSTRMTVRGDTFYGAWHSTDTIEVYDLAMNQPLSPITLEDYDGWILGMSVTDDGQLVISGDSWGDTVYVFDVHTGQKLRELHPTTPVTGLSCVTRRRE